ncbi:protein hunchback [Ceratina calcarata]|uniref:Protein hunchback n=1 Tax=Ceratina calcarata TaxID=156304 RepID=A0AAJ7J479_9HYME|nr:protein hunchback [Ceratina calcarata]
MRGNWETAELPAQMTTQQRQQQSTVAEQRQALQSPTTPAWSTGNRIVKAEPTEDKNDDSGVSPGHYASNTSTSSRSGASTSTANCSLSPASVNSLDSNNIQCSSFDCSPQGKLKNRTSPADKYRSRAIGNNQEQAAESKSANAEADQGSLVCPICRSTSKDRLHLTEHLATHCTAKSETQEFVKAVLDQLMPGPSGTTQDDNRSLSTQGERSEQDMEETEEPGLRVPRLNSQGKVKTYKCKQCDFVAITKLQFWEHSRIHIKAEKLLTCPKCPFVTEYKHHLEYHLRNHYGSKPYKCDKCPYSCVNKSMLNSHLKSHSNVYQYSCANCTYATKYCHSLKLHLRKYQHQPAMVLNADGTPNPLPIIDVYGTRRGPKARPSRTTKATRSSTQEDLCHSNNAGMNNVQGGIPTTSTAQHPATAQNPALAHNVQVQPMSSANSMIAVNSVNAVINMSALDNMSAGSGSMNAANNMNAATTGLPAMGQPQAVIHYPYSQLYAGFSMMHHPNTEANGAEKPLDQNRSSILMDYLKAASDGRMPEEEPQNLAIRSYNGHNAPNGSLNGVPYNSEIPKMNEQQMEPSSSYPGEYMEDNEAPLDLSKPSTSTLQRPTGAVSSSRATGTSRRKGKAVKLDRRIVEVDTDDEQQYPPQQMTSEPPATSSQANREDGEESQRPSLSSEFFCPYCEIVFGNVVMYTVHMGYHGYNDPYTCNMCGHQCTDKVSFFLHIARSKHA